MFKIIGADQKQYGPISIEQIRQWVRDGRLNDQTSAQRAGETEWQPLATFEEFADLFQPAADAATPGGPAPAYAPSAVPGSVPTGSRESALSAVKGPAIALIIVGALGIVYYLLSALLAVSGHAPHREVPANASPFVRSFIEGSQGPLAMAFQLIFAAGSAVVLLGALKMMKLRNHTFAIITCIAAMLPSVGCCCIFGLPFAIWGLVILNKPEVKSHFTN